MPPGHSGPPWHQRCLQRPSSHALWGRAASPVPWDFLGLTDADLGQAQPHTRVTPWAPDWGSGGRGGLWQRNELGRHGGERVRTEWCE